MKQSEVALLEISLTDKATLWISEQTEQKKQYNDTKVALVLWLNVSSS